jgi:phosphopantetheine--protein transferase-like protein
MVGIDIVKINRFKQNIGLWSKKILTDHEKEELTKRTNQLQYIASRWASKEAFFKCTGSIENVSILNDKNNKPYILNHPDLEISISHEKDFCIAIVINKL